jgi:hypothetical protein
VLAHRLFARDVSTAGREAAEEHSKRANASRAVGAADRQLPWAFTNRHGDLCSPSEREAF